MVSSKIVSVAVVVLVAQIAVISASEVAEDRPAAEVVRASLPKLSLGGTEAKPIKTEECKPDSNCVKPPCKCSHHEPTTPRKAQTPSKKERKSRSPERRRLSPERKATSPERKTLSEKYEKQASPRKSRSPVRNGAGSTTKTRAISPGRENAQRKGATSPAKKVEAASAPAESHVHKHSCCGHQH